MENISVIKIRDILLVTIQEEPDDEIISRLQSQVLEAMERYQSRGLILDISLVTTLDSFFARTILETGQMVKLMGGNTVIAGMQPGVAITAIQLGLPLANLHSVLSVDMALDYFEQKNEEI